jgi:hypothetical protein
MKPYLTLSSTAQKLHLDMSYLTTLNDVIPAGRVVVHNRVRPSMRERLGSRGFRAWHQKPDDNLVVCGCGWAPKFGIHYITKLNAAMPEAPKRR